MKSERISDVDAQKRRMAACTLPGAGEHAAAVCGGAASCTVPRIFLYRGLALDGEQEMILLVTGLTRNDRAMEFIRLCGCNGLEFAGVLLPEDTDELQRQAEALLRSEQKERL